MVSMHAITAAANLRALLHPHHGWSPKTEIIFPDNSSFAQFTDRWSVYEPPTFKAAVRAGSEEDVQKAVRIATSHDVPFLATGGRHGYSTSFGGLENGIEIDLSLLKKVKVNADENTLTVGGGVIARDIYDPLYEAGKELQTGSCSCVGLLGSTLGGGVGRYQGLHGLIIDALLEVRLVTASGEVVVASERSEPELFWGIRGAGFNFGIVTEAKYRVSDLTHSGKVQSADLIFPASSAADYFKTLKDLVEVLPKEMSAITVATWNDTTSEAQLISNLVYPGPKDTFQKYIQPFLDLKPNLQVIQTIPWNTLVQTTLLGLDAALCADGAPHSIYGINIREVNAHTYTKIFNEMNDYYASTPAARPSVLVWEHFPNQAVAAVPKSATAYPWRDAKANIMVQMSWTDDSVAAKTNALARSMRSDIVSTGGYGHEAIYVSYAHSDEALKNIYGATHLPRLAALKKKWDPKNAFAFNNAIPPNYHSD